MDGRADNMDPISAIGGGIGIARGMFEFLGYVRVEAISQIGGIPIAVTAIDRYRQYEGNRGPGQRWRRARRDRRPAVFKDPLQAWRRERDSSDLGCNR